MAASNVPFLYVIVHQPGQEAQPPVPIKFVNQKLHLKRLEEELKLTDIRIIHADYPEGVHFIADNAGLVNLNFLEPGSTIEVCGLPAPGLDCVEELKRQFIRHCLCCRQIELERQKVELERQKAELDATLGAVSQKIAELETKLKDC